MREPKLMCRVGYIFNREKIIGGGDIEAMATAVVTIFRAHALSVRLVEEWRKMAPEFGLDQHGRRIMELYRRIAL